MCFPRTDRCCSSSSSSSAQWQATPCTARAHRPDLSPCLLPRTVIGILSANVLHALAQTRPHRRPAPARPSPAELSSKCPRSHTSSSLSFDAARPCLSRPLNAAHVVDMMTVNDLLVLYTVAPDGRRHPALAPAQCTLPMDLVGVADVVSPAQTPSAMRPRRLAR
jgi:hypothetical protein